jgi:4-hydroxybenzoate polyprenyltransferase
VDRLVLFLEKDRLSIPLLFLYILAVALIRDISEYYLLDRTFVIEPHPWIYSIAHHVVFYYLTFFGLVLLLSAFGRRGVRKAMNYVSTFFWIIILPPFLDHFLFGSNNNYAYFSPTDFLNYVLHFSGAAFHPGQGIEIVVVVFALIAYTVWVKRASFGSVGGRVVVTLEVGLLVLFTFMSLFIMATPGAYLPVGSLDGKPSFPSFDVTRYFQFHLFIFAYYIILLLGILAALVYLNNPRIFKRLALSLRPVQTLFFMGIVAAGIVTGWSSAAGNVYIERILDKPYWVNLEFVLISLTSAMLAWLVSTMWNDLSDQGADSPERAERALASGLIGRKELAGISLVLMALSLVLGALLSWVHLALLGAIYLLAFIYSLPPVRFKEHLLSPLLIGAGAFLAFLYGAATPLSPIRLYLDNPDLVWPDSWNVILPTPTMQAVVIGTYMFIGLVVGSMVTDIEGYSEDTRGRVSTIYTRLGLEKGKRVVAALILLAALTPLALFHQVGDLLIFPLLGAAAAVAFQRTGRSRYVLLIAMVGMLYAAWRFLPSLA